MNFILALLGGKLVPLTALRASRMYGPLKNTPAGEGLVPDLLTIPEAARLLKVSVSGMRRLQQQRRVAFYKVGGSVRFARQDIARYLSKNRIDPPAS